MSSSGWWAPVEVSAWTIPTTFVPGNVRKAPAIASGSITSPQGASTGWATAPYLSATSSMRVPKTPLTHTIISSSGSIRFATHVSIPALPVPGIATVSSFAVRNTICRSFRIPSMIRRYSGSRWPIVGAARASSTLLDTSLGPGPRRIRLGGFSGPLVLAMVLPFHDLHDSPQKEPAISISPAQLSGTAVSVSTQPHQRKPHEGADG
jgi:hypothetical protein